MKRDTELEQLKAQYYRSMRSEGTLQEPKPGAPQMFYVFADERVNFSGIQLEENTQYQFCLEPLDYWFDQSISAHPTNGWGDQQYSLCLQALRYAGRKWSYSPKHDLVVLLGGIVGDSGGVFAFADYMYKQQSAKTKISGTFEAQKTGEFYALANDAKWDYFYNNNCGYVTITLEALPKDEPEH